MAGSRQRRPRTPDAGGTRRTHVRTRHGQRGGLLRRRRGVPRRRGSAWRFVSFVASLPARVTPYAWRYRVAVCLAFLLQPVIIAGRRFIVPLERSRQHTLFERALGTLLNTWHTTRVAFPLPTRFDSDVPIQGPLLLLAPHGPMNQAALRTVADTGVGMAIGRARLPGSDRVFGSTQPVDVIPSRQRVTFLRTVARRLRAGDVVMTTIDTMRGERGYRHPVTPAVRDWYVSDQMIALAHRHDIPTALCICEAAWAGVSVTVRRLRSPDVEGRTREVVEYLLASASRHLRPPPAR